MISIFESILPIFIIVAPGVRLSACHLYDQNVWPGAGDRLGYYLLFPALLFLTHRHGGFFQPEAGRRIAGGACWRITIMKRRAPGPVIRLSALSLGACPDAKLQPPCFDIGSRWNAFIGWPIAREAFRAPAAWRTGSALVMEVIIIPLNFINSGRAGLVMHRARSDEPFL